MSDPTQPPAIDPIPPSTAIAPTMPYATPGLVGPSVLPPGYIEPDPSMRTMAMLAHLLQFAGGWVGPLVLFLIKKDDPTTNAYAKGQMKEVLNWDFTLMICIFVLCITIIGILAVPFVALGHMIFVILNAIKANKGEVAKYPWSIKFLK